MTEAAAQRRGTPVSSSSAPTACPSARPRREAEGEENGGLRISEMVSRPRPRFMRIGSMIKQLLDEVRAAPLDDASRAFGCGTIHQRSIKELEDGLAPELRERARNGLSLAVPPRDSTPSDAELRIAQAQLVGWLEGLFHGIQTALFAPADGCASAARGHASARACLQGYPPGHGPARPTRLHRPVPLGTAASLGDFTAGSPPLAALTDG